MAGARVGWGGRRVSGVHSWGRGRGRARGRRALAARGRQLGAAGAAQAPGGQSADGECRDGGRAQADTPAATNCGGDAHGLNGALRLPAVRAMVLERQPGELVERELPDPEPGPGEALVRVHACGVCRTDLHIVDGELPAPRLPLVPGHQVVGTVVAVGPPEGGTATEVGVAPGQLVGVPWLAWTCGSCRYCRNGRENLCDRAEFTGLHRDGGYAELCVADVRFCLPLPGTARPELAPLLCAGLIGFRSLRSAERDLFGDEPARIGIYGFGAAAHLVAQIAAARGHRVYALTRPGDSDAQRLALELGCEWAGPTAPGPPVELDAAIVFAPAGELVPLALRAVRKGGRVVCGGIHMSDIPSFPYRDLWGERTLVSVANLTRNDGHALFAEVARHPVHVAVERFALAEANDALARLRAGRVRGAAVLVVESD